jgi:hypothetical protein
MSHHPAVWVSLLAFFHFVLSIGVLTLLNLEHNLNLLKGAMNWNPKKA